MLRRPSGVPSSTLAMKGTCIIPVISTGIVEPSTRDLSVSALTTVQRRHLAWAKSTFGFKLWRYGQRKYPAFRSRGGYSSEKSANYTVAHHYYQHFGPQYASSLLPKHNYICGNYTGAFYLHNHTYYTLKHATSGVPIRLRRQPAFYTFTDNNRWMIGKQLRTQVDTSIKMADEQSMPKRIRMGWVKRGWLAA